MWNEPSIGFALTAKEAEDSNLPPSPAEISTVEKGSIGEDLGFEPGDRLVSINGIRPRDLIDYRYLIVEETLRIEVIDIQGKVHIVNFEKDIDDSLGLGFKEALFDGLRQCNNRCGFCFIDQQPPGRRKSLYLKDDDFRLSFLYGSYLTLTNLRDKDWQRIETQRLSPLFVSVHSTDPMIRSRLLKNPRAVLLKEQLDWFSERNLQIHAQVVVCPGLNDGEALERTLMDLSKYGKGKWPTVISTAVVPVGLTKFRPANDGLLPVSTQCAVQVIKQVEALQQPFQKSLDSHFAWLADEWYLIANKSLPPRCTYEDFPQQENGVGSIRAFLEMMEKATQSLPKSLKTQRRCSWVVGKLVKNALEPICNRMNSIEGLKIKLHGLPSLFWGTEQVVTGLLTGQDLIDGLKGADLGDQLLLPSVMLLQGQEVFLDDMSLAQVSRALNVPIQIVHGPEDIVSAALGDLAEIH